MPKELFTFCILATVDDLERARPLCLEWIKRWQPQTAQIAAEMLPTPLSPTGKAPATHQLCAMCGTRAEFDDMQTFIATHGVPVDATLVGRQEDKSLFTIETRDKWLPTRGLKVIG
jgi:hypothetical protein